MVQCQNIQNNQSKKEKLFDAANKTSIALTKNLDSTQSGDPSKESPSLDPSEEPSLLDPLEDCLLADRGWTIFRTVLPTNSNRIQRRSGSRRAQGAARISKELRSQRNGGIRHSVQDLRLAPTYVVHESTTAVAIIEKRIATRVELGLYRLPVSSSLIPEGSKVIL